MTRKISMALAVLFVVLASAATLLQSTYAAIYTIGDSTGWQIPNDDFYDNWADNKNFVVGDILVFNFTTGQQDVAEVTEADYDACTTTNTLFTERNGPARIRLNRTGEHYFICTFHDNCPRGQKLNVEVLPGMIATPPTPAASSPNTAPTSGSSPNTALDKPGSSPNIPGVSTVDNPTFSSASSVVATLSIVFISIALVLSF